MDEESCEDLVFETKSDTRSDHAELPRPKRSCEIHAVPCGPAVVTDGKLETTRPHALVGALPGVKRPIRNCQSACACWERDTVPCRLQTSWYRGGRGYVHIAGRRGRVSRWVVFVARFRTHIRPAERNNMRTHVIVGLFTAGQAVRVAASWIRTEF